eukprot:CAMPEP_0171204342 /NCGR_PEP_ID=MMETSP0790-20130122/25992_1 /TAXON_ID=2925 /ORGANISM="Alexandrium catenella, Strain OF101" /LENGTH=390 /DNA_ID=CAMNT_0011669841 /DNA_START=72 /DNA_END=1244 /DNA_ORIENTATION=-
MSEEHQEYCDKKVYPLIEKLVTQTLVARPDLPVPYMVKWLAEESKKTIPTQKILLKEEMEELQSQIGTLEKHLARLNEDVWILAIGPELDAEALGRQKGVKILESELAIARGWRLSFSAKGIPMVEPAFVNAEKGDELDEVHGMAFQIARDQLHLVDAVEYGWERKAAKLESYEGREMEGYVYTAKHHAKVEESPPSARYLATVLKAFREGGLAADYIDSVAKTPIYKVGTVTLKARQDLPPPHELKEVTCEELADIGDVDQASHVACLGYVFRVPKAKIYVGSHRGREVTARVLRQFRGEPEQGGEKGLPPYPSLENLSPEEQEYVHQWLDHYIWAGGSGAVVGFVSEFRQQLEEAKLGDDSYEDDAEHEPVPGEDQEEESAESRTTSG